MGREERVSQAALRVLQEDKDTFGDRHALVLSLLEQAGLTGEGVWELYEACGQNITMWHSAVILGTAREVIRMHKGGSDGRPDTENA